MHTHIIPVNMDIIGISLTVNYVSFDWLMLHSSTFTWIYFKCIFLILHIFNTLMHILYFKFWNNDLVDNEIQEFIAYNWIFLVIFEAYILGRDLSFILYFRLVSGTWSYCRDRIRDLKLLSYLYQRLEVIVVIVSETWSYWRNCIRDLKLLS